MVEKNEFINYFNDGLSNVKISKYKMLFLFLPFLTIFFPYIGFLQGIDIQPFFIFVLFFFLLFNFKNIKCDSYFIIFFFSYSVIELFFIISYPEISYVINRLFFVCVLIIVYLFVYNFYNYFKLKHIIWFGFIYISVGFIQLYDPYFATDLVSRSVDNIDNLISSGRGVRSLTGEPSHFGKIIIILNLCYIVFYFKNNCLLINKKEIYNITFFTTSLLTINLLLSQSAYMLLIHLFLILLFIFSFNKKAVSYFLILLLIIAISQFSNFSLFDGGRLSFLFDLVISEPQLLMEQGAFKRLLNIPISIHSLQNYGVFGAGGSKEVFDAKIWTPLGYYNYISASKSFGGVVELVLIHGLFSLFFLFNYFYWLFRISKIKLILNGNKVNFGFFIAFGVFILSFQDGSINNPIIWFMVFYFYIFSKKHNLYFTG